MTSWALEDWDHVSRSMAVMIEWESGEACLPASSCGSFLANAGLGLGSRLPLSVSTTDSLSQILPTEFMTGPEGGLSSCPVRGDL